MNDPALVENGVRTKQQAAVFGAEEVLLPPIATTRRRWFQFSTGTLFLLMTVFVVWLSSQMNLVQQRRELRKLLEETRGIEVLSVLTTTASGANRIDSPTIPFWRRWMGDEPLALISFDPEIDLFEILGEHRLEQISFAFPEAKAKALGISCGPLEEN